MLYSTLPFITPKLNILSLNLIVELNILILILEFVLEFSTAVTLYHLAFSYFNL